MVRKLLFIVLLCWGVNSGWAEDIVTVSGQTYANARVTRINTDSIVVFHDGGISTVPLHELSEELKKKLGIDVEALRELAENKKAARAAEVQELMSQEDAFFEMVVDGSISGAFLDKMRNFTASKDYPGTNGEPILMACACRYILSGNMAEYSNTTKYLDTKYPHSDYQREIQVTDMSATCPSCHGDGKTTVQCDDCAGTGSCRKCSGSGRLEPLMGGAAARSQPCTKCRSTGRCLKCSGSGNLTRNCMTCLGKGKTESRKLKTEFYESCLADIGQKHKNLLELARLEKERREERLAEIEAKKEAILVDAKISAEKKAELELTLRKEEADRIRMEQENQKYAKVDTTYLKSIVLMKGDRGSGTGFLCKLAGRNVVLSNAHVLLGNRVLTIKTIAGRVLEYSTIRVCKGRDIVAYEIKEPGNLQYLTIHDNVAGMNNQEPIVVFGNSAGGGVVTTLRGKMQGLGPDKIEVDAAFVAGNSGSPIIAYPYDAVVGMATYLTREPEVDWTNKSTRFADIRRYGVRVDNVSWEDFQVLDMSEYTSALDIFDIIYDFGILEFRKAQESSSFNYVEFRSRETAKRLLDQYNATPSWMREYAEDAAIGAYVCKILCVDSL
jgi:hypothetical protein